MASSFDLTGKVAIVTGGAQGIGAAIASMLAGHGASIVIVDINEDAAGKTAERLAASPANAAVRAVACDVRDAGQIQSLVDTVQSDFGRIDVLVNNAGIHRRVQPFDHRDDDIRDQFDVNLVGCFRMASAVGQVMAEQRSGSIINMSALGGGLMGLGRGGSIYGITKGGIVALTRDLAAEWGGYDVRVNAVAPGWIRTPMTIALQQDQQKSAKVLERVPLGRWGEPDDVAGPVLFLASDASRYITGCVIPVDGGAANVIALSDE